MVQAGIADAADGLERDDGEEWHREACDYGESDAEAWSEGDSPQHSGHNHGMPDIPICSQAQLVSRIAEITGEAVPSIAAIASAADLPVRQLACRLVQMNDWDQLAADVAHLTLMQHRWPDSPTGSGDQRITVQAAFSLIERCFMSSYERHIVHGSFTRRSEAEAQVMQHVREVVAEIWHAGPP
jgi:hypothetical protein